MRTKTLPGGVERAIHVFTPALVERLKGGPHQPVMAVRCRTSDYCRMRLCYRVEIHGKSEMKEIFDNPLPGTDGRGVAILFTKAPITIYYGEKLMSVNTCNKKPDQIQKRVQKYLKSGLI